MKFTNSTYIYLLMFVSFLIPSNSYTQSVKLSEAKKIYQSFREKHSGKNSHIKYNSENLQIDSLITSKGNCNSAYIFSRNKDHFVLISGLKQIKPVLAYSWKNDFPANDLPPNVQELMDFYVRMTNELKSDSIQENAIHPGWKNIDSTKSSLSIKKSGSPLLDTEWDQGKGWNKFCPVDSAGPGNHVYAGCVAVAMAQAMSKYNHPDTGKGSKSFVSEYGLLTANFGDTEYKWEQMSNTNPDDHNAKLLYHCGIAVEMMYGADGSGAYTFSVPNVMKKYFDYSPTMFYTEKFTNSDMWSDTLKRQLDIGMPIIYSGSGSDGSGGHAFNVDGYDSFGAFHINWGWSGSYNGYYSLNDLTPSSGHNYSYGQGAVLNIKPFDHSPRDIILSSSKVMEMQDSATLVGVLSTKDPDNNESFKYTLKENSGGIDDSSTTDGDFFLDEDSLKTNKKFKYGEHNERKIKITTKDKDSLTLTKEFTIKIKKCNHPPDSIILSDTTIMENSDLNTIVGTFETIDIDDSTHTYKLIDSLFNGQKNQNKFFSIDNKNNLVLTSRINFGGYEQFIVFVQSKDNSGGSTADIFSIDILKDTTEITSSPAFYNKGGIAIFPNPVKSNLNLKIPQRSKDLTLCIYSLKGEKIFQTRLSNYDTSLPGSVLNTGLNIIVIKKANNILYKKHIIKQ